MDGKTTTTTSTKQKNTPSNQVQSVEPEKVVEAPTDDGGWIEVGRKKKKNNLNNNNNNNNNTNNVVSSKSSKTSGNRNNKNNNNTKAKNNNRGGKRSPTSGNNRTDQRRGEKSIQQKSEHPMKEQWTKERQELQSRIINSDQYDWALNLTSNNGEGSSTNSWAKMLFPSSGGNKGKKENVEASVTIEPTKQLTYVGGVDLNYMKGNLKGDTAASLVVCSFPSFELVYHQARKVVLKKPQIAGLQTFREVDPLVELVDELRTSNPNLVPQVLLVRTNSLPNKGFSLARHLGVLLDIPTIGVAKKAVNIDGLSEPQIKKLASEHLNSLGEAMELSNRSGKVLGAAMKIDKSPSPIYISQGHRITLKSAVDVVRACCKEKFPEPMYQAELKSKSVLPKVDKKSGNKQSRSGGGNAKKGQPNKTSTNNIATTSTSNGNNNNNKRDSNKSPQPAGNKQAGVQNTKSGHKNSNEGKSLKVNAAAAAPSSQTTLLEDNTSSVPTQQTPPPAASAAPRSQNKNVWQKRAESLAQQNSTPQVVAETTSTKKPTATNTKTQQNGHTATGAKTRKEKKIN